jgi:hypothetical protein
VTGTGDLSKAFSCQAVGEDDMSKRILVVEDQADNRQIIRDMLAPITKSLKPRMGENSAVHAPIGSIDCCTA